MKTIPCLALIFVLLFSSQSFSQSSNTSKDKFFKYISAELGYGKPEFIISNKDDISNNFKLNSGSEIYGGISVKTPYLTPGIFYYVNSLAIQSTSPGSFNTYSNHVKNSYLAITALYDLLEVNINKVFFVNLKLGLSGLFLLSEENDRPAPSSTTFSSKSFLWTANGKLETAFNTQSIGIIAGIDYTNTLSNMLIYNLPNSHNQYHLKSSSFRFYGGIRKYF